MTSTPFIHRRRVRAVLAIGVMVFLGLVAFIALQLVLSQPKLHRKGGSYEAADAEARPWRKVLDGAGHRAHLGGARPVPCADCHEIKPDGFTAPGAARCATCHADVKPTIHQAATAAAETRECTTCHAFLSSDESTGPWDCIRCHGDTQGSFSAVAVHAKEACGGCHRPHSTPALQPAPCDSCHKDQKTHHGAHEQGVSLCLDCHQPHEKAGTADHKCVTCHTPELAAGGKPGKPARPARPVTRPGASAAGTSAKAAVAPLVPATALSPDGHQRCTGCHKPHEFTKAGVVACRSCHATQVTLGQFTVAKHADCKSCHDPHDPIGKAAGRCTSCHQPVRTDHPTSPKGACLGCHVVHSKTPQPRPAVACASCHTKATTDAAFHVGGVTCAGCHKPHLFKKPPIATCTSCHRPEAALAGTGGHAACAGCHVPHAPKTAPPTCTSCHAPQAAQVAGNPGHQKCGDCHRGSHAPRRDLATCASCHAAESRSAPQGHLECATCHEPHRGTVAKRCESCHADRAGGNHAAVKGGCATCHQPHAGTKGPAKPPTCVSCHADGRKLPGLHDKPGHRDCAGCHTSHGAPRGDRATCQTCHPKSATHEPGSQKCTGCHVFRGAR